MNVTIEEPSTPQPQVPCVTVIITVFNCALYLAEAIESVFAQRTNATWELLIVDDGSTDGSLHIAREYAGRFPDRISVLQHPGGTNCGISSSRNLALGHARGEIIAFLDADDVWLPNKLALQLPQLLGMPEVAMIYAAAERWWDFTLPFNPAAGPLGDNSVPPLIPANAVPGIIQPPKLLEWFRADESMTPCTCTVLVRTAIARALGGFVDRFEGLYDDQAFYAKLALTQTVFVSLEVVARYRQHPASCCARARRDAAVRQAEEAMFEQWLSRWLAEETAVESPGTVATVSAHP